MIVSIASFWPRASFGIDRAAGFVAAGVEAFPRMLEKTYPLVRAETKDAVVLQFGRLKFRAAALDAALRATCARRTLTGDHNEIAEKRTVRSP